MWYIVYLSHDSLANSTRDSSLRFTGYQCSTIGALLKINPAAFYSEDDSSLHSGFASINQQGQGGLRIQRRESYEADIQNKFSELRLSGSVIENLNQRAGPYGLVLGDTYSRNLLRFIEKSIQTESVPYFKYIANNKCPPILNPKLSVSNYGPPGSDLAQENICKQGAKDAKRAIEKERPAVIILASRWQDYMFGYRTIYDVDRTPVPLLPFNDAMARIGLTLEEAANLSDKVRVIGLVPYPRHDTLTCLRGRMDRAVLSSDAANYCPLDFQPPNSEVKWNADFGEYIMANHHGVKYVDVIQESQLCRRDNSSTIKCMAWSETDGPMHSDKQGNLTYKGLIAATSSLSL